MSETDHKQEINIHEYQKLVDETLEDEEKVDKINIEDYLDEETMKLKYKEYIDKLQKNKPNPVESKTVNGKTIYKSETKAGLRKGTKKNNEDVLEMYRRMVFNVLIDNQDDHAKNFSFIYDDINKTYRLSPAYDITPGRTYYGEHTTSVNGKGRDITVEDMLEVAIKNKIELNAARMIINKCKSVIKNLIL